MTLWGSLPADQGAVVAQALDRVAHHLPQLPDEVSSLTAEGPSTIAIRRADALVALASATIASDHDPDRATVVVHAPLSALTGAGDNGTLAGGPPLPAEVVQRLACDCRLQTVLHGEDGIVGIGMTSRNIPRWLRRAVEYRDGFRCTFPGCGARRFVEIHHIVAWPRAPPISKTSCACARFITTCSISTAGMRRSGPLECRVGFVPTGPLTNPVPPRWLCGTNAADDTHTRFCVELRDTPASRTSGVDSRAKPSR
jgi:hypothetical protein